MRIAMIMMGLLMVGCASKQSVEQSGGFLRSEYIDKPASSMAFQHPAMADNAPGFYSREGLAPGAFVAFEQPEITVFRIQTDDRLEGEDGWMYRRAVTQRLGVSYR
jgi:hypothetical protein